MKRIISILLSTVILVMSMGISVSAEKKPIDMEKWNFIINFDIIYTEKIEDMANIKVTRGDFVTYLIYLMNKGNIGYEGESLFSDVTDMDDCFETANVAKQLGYITGNVLRPYDNITYAEAREMILRAMGYSGLGQNMINKVDLPSYSGSYVMTYNDVVECFYAAMHAPLLKYNIESTGGSIEYTVDDNKTILSECYKVEIIEGIVTENCRTTLYNYEKAIDSYVGINDEKYGDSKNIADSWLGYNVRAYIDYTYDKEDGNLVYIAKKQNKNTEITLTPDEIDSVSNDVSRISYTKDGNRSTSKRIDENVCVIYNGKAYTKYTPKDLQPENGSVTLIDNNSDGTFDVVKVWSYQTMFVDRISGNKIISNKFDFSGALQQISLDNISGTFDFEIFENDSKKEFSRLKAGQILSVAQSKNTTDGYIRINIATYEETGVYEGINRNEMTINVSGTSYKITPEFVKEYTNIEMGKTYKFYFDCFGQIAGAVIVADAELAYVYMYSVIYDDSDEAAFIKLFNAANEWQTYCINDKIILNGKKVAPNILTEYNPGQTRKQLVDEFGKSVKQIINVKIVDGKIISIETATPDGEIGTFNTSGKKKLRYYGQNKSFGHEYFVLGKTVIYAVPMDDPTNLDAYKTVIAPSWDKDYQVEAYAWDEYYGASAIIMEAEDSFFDKSIPDCLILGTGTMLGGDGTPVEYVDVSFKGFESLKVEIADGFDISEVNSGDIATIKINESGQLYSIDRPTHRSYSFVKDGKTPSRPANLHTDSIQRGTVIKADPVNEIFLAYLDNSGKPVAIKADYIDLIVRRYNIENRTCQMSSLYELEAGDFFVMYSGGSYSYCITVYEDE